MENVLTVQQMNIFDVQADDTSKDKFKKEICPS